MDAKESAGGFRIPPVGGGSGRNLIMPSVGNEVVSKLNTLGKISIVRSAGDRDEVFYSDSNVVLSLGASAGENVTGSVTVSETDGTPSVTNVTQIKFPAGTVTNDGGGVVTVAVGTITVEEQDAAPSVANVSKIKFPNGSVTDEGSGVVSVATSSGLTVQEDDGAPLVEDVHTIKFDGLEVTDDTGGVVTVRAPFASWGSGRGADYYLFEYSEVTSTNYTNNTTNVLTITEDGVYVLYYIYDVSGTANSGASVAITFETDYAGTWTDSASSPSAFLGLGGGRPSNATVPYFLPAGTEITMKTTSSGLTSGSHSWNIAARFYRMA